jgi:hypothetical protein
MQLDLARGRSDTQGTQQVQTRVVLQTGAHRGCLPARCPSSFEWRHQRKPTFIGENEGCA